VAALVRLAFLNPQVRSVQVHTLLTDPAAGRVSRRAGLRLVGSMRSDRREAVLRWRATREALSA
jgi:hypothetical protein